MGRSIKKIAEGYQISEKAIEILVDASNSGLLKAWREFIDLEKVIELGLIVKEKDVNQIFRRQGLIAGLGAIDNKISNILEEMKENE